MASNSTLTPVVMSKAKKKTAPAHDITPKDMSRDLNFTKDGKPRLNATSGKGEGAMGQRR